jgi:hypothetical protein
MTTLDKRRQIQAQPEPRLSPSGKWWIGLEIGARQVVEQHVVADIEQIAPPFHQMISAGKVLIASTSAKVVPLNRSK